MRQFLFSLFDVPMQKRKKVELNIFKVAAQRLLSKKKKKSELFLISDSSLFIFLQHA
jgi:hypothetical protein